MFCGIPGGILGRKPLLSEQSTAQFPKQAEQGFNSAEQRRLREARTSRRTLIENGGPAAKKHLGRAAEQYLADGFITPVA